MTCDASSLFSATTLVTMALIMLIGDCSTTCHDMRHLAHAPPSAAPIYRCPEHSNRAEAVDRARGQPFTDSRHTDGSRDGRRATYTCGVEHRCTAPMSAAVSTIMPKVTLPPMPAVMSKVGALLSMPVVVPKVGDLPLIPSVWPMPNSRCPPSRQHWSPLSLTNATQTRWTGPWS